MQRPREMPHLEHLESLGMKTLGSYLPSPYIPLQPNHHYHLTSVLHQRDFLQTLVVVRSCVLVQTFACLALGRALTVLLDASPSSAMKLLTKRFVESGLWNTPSCIAFLRARHVAHKVTTNFTKES